MNTWEENYGYLETKTLSFLIVNKIIKTLSLTFILNILLKLLMLISEKGKYCDMHFTAFQSD